MLAGSDRRQGFFDAAWCAGLVAENSVYSLLAKHGDRIERDEDFAECYSARWGRPSIAPSRLAQGVVVGLPQSRSRATIEVRDDRWCRYRSDRPISIKSD